MPADRADTDSAAHAATTPNHRMPDRPKWTTPRDAPRFRLTAANLAGFPEGTALAVPAGFTPHGAGPEVELSVEKVGRKWQVHQRRGFDAYHLEGVPARKRERRPETAHTTS